MSGRVPARPAATVLAVAALAGILAGCGSASTSTIDHHELRLTEEDFRILPYRSSVPGGRLKIVVRNVGALTHNLAIEAGSGDGRTGGHVFATIPTIHPGGVGGPIKVTLPPGTYVLVSTVANQADLGMVATLVVRPGA